MCTNLIHKHPILTKLFDISNQGFYYQVFNFILKEMAYMIILLYFSFLWCSTIFIVTWKIVCTMKETWPSSDLEPNFKKKYSQKNLNLDDFIITYTLSIELWLENYQCVLVEFKINEPLHSFNASIIFIWNPTLPFTTIDNSQFTLQKTNVNLLMI